MPKGISGRLACRQRFWSKVKKTRNCWLWVGCRYRNGYGHFRVRDDVHIGAHRFSWELYNGSIPDGLLVCHVCDVRHCVNPKHLFLGSPKDNMQDAVKRGRISGGEQHFNAKLSCGDIRQIRRLYALRLFSMRELASRFDTCYSNINNIINYRRWNNR